MATVTTTNQIQRTYRDISLSFGLNPVTNDVMSVTGSDDVKQAVRVLLLTLTGEVPFFPGFGSQLQQLLFQPADPITTALLTQEIQATLTAFEPRVSILQLQVTPTPDQHQYQVFLELQILNQLTPITTTIFLERIR